MVVGGAVQVCDFGLARMIGADRVTSAAASVAYASPELLETGKACPSTDQYSLAVTYYELRTGKLPYFEETLVAVVEAKHRGNLDFSACAPAEQEVLRPLVDALNAARAHLPGPGGRHRRLFLALADEHT
jgi:serine/threonine protein kinase